MRIYKITEASDYLGVSIRSGAIAPPARSYLKTSQAVSSIDDMQKIMDANEKLVKELKNESNSSN